MAGIKADERGCARAREWASLRVDGELSELERLLLQRHLGRCERCREFADGVDTASGVLRATTAERPSRALAPVVSLNRPRVRARALAVAAVLLVGAGLGSIAGLQGGEDRPAVPQPTTEISFLPPGQEPSPRVTPPLRGRAGVEPPGESV